MKIASIITNYKNINILILFKGAVSFIATLLPFNFLRVFFLNLIPGFKIEKSKVGNFNFFFSKTIKINNSKIGNFNFFLIERIDCKNHSIIGSRNEIFSKATTSYMSLNKSQISINSFFSLSKITMFGENVVFGGMNSKILTDENCKEKTNLEKNIFIGSNSIIKSGIYINNNIVIGAGSIILNSIETPGLYYSKKLNKYEI